METAFIGLGSNLDNPVEQVCQAIEDLSRWPDIELVNTSSLYLSPPMGPQDQPDYINAVAEIATSLSAHALLAQLLVIEQQHGRIRTGERWTARALDLDLLIYGQKIINEVELVIPHPGLYERAFVLYPLHEIAPDLAVPGYGQVSQLMDHCDPTSIQILDGVKCE